MSLSNITKSVIIMYGTEVTYISTSLTIAPSGAYIRTEGSSTTIKVLEEDDIEGWREQYGVYDINPDVVFYTYYEPQKGDRIVRNGVKYVIVRTNKAKLGNMGGYYWMACKRLDVEET